MKIDFFSDPHWDFYFNPDTAFSLNKLNAYLEKAFSNQGSDILIIAGDTGHYPYQDKLLLGELRERYSKIFVVLGNHNLYCVSNNQRSHFKTWIEKFEHNKNELNSVDGVQVLDGDVVEVNGKTIGGTMGWYDGSFYFANNQHIYSENIQERWKRVMNDANLIPGLKDFLDIWVQERPKIKSICESNPDLIVTHYVPTILKRAFSDQYKNDLNNAFYSFDGSEFLDYTETKTWIYGHTHTPHEFMYAGTRILCNPFGYPGENKDFKVQTIEI